MNLCAKIQIGIYILKNNYQYIEEKKLVSKLSDNDLDSFSEIDLSDDKPEINSIVNFIKCVFNIIKEMINSLEKGICNDNIITHFDLITNTLLKFLKFFYQNI